MTRLSDAFEWAWADAHDLIGFTDRNGLRRWVVRGMVDRGVRLRVAEDWADDILRCAAPDYGVSVASPVRRELVLVVGVPRPVLRSVGASSV